MHTSHLRTTCTFTTRHLVRLGAVILVVATLTLAGCGGGGGSAGTDTTGTSGTNGTNATNPGTSGSTISDERRSAVIDAATEQCRQLSAQKLSTDDFNKAMAAYLASQPEYAESGIDQETNSIWGRFTDGRLHIIANNRSLLPETAPGKVIAKAAAIAASTGQKLMPQQSVLSNIKAALTKTVASAQMPTSKQVRLLQTFGADMWPQQAINEISPWFKEKGYSVISSGNAGVEDFRSVSGDAFLYIHTHGGSGKAIDLKDDGWDYSEYESWYCVQTATLKSIALEYKYVEDLVAKRLVYLTAHNGKMVTVISTINGITQVEDWDTRYGITRNFIDTYWAASPQNSIILMHACNSAGPSNGNKNFVNSVLKKNPGVYLGWSNSLSQGVAQTSIRYLADRLLGVNRHSQESPNQRPFDLQSILQDMRTYHLDTGTNGEKLLDFATTENAMTILTPSIKRMKIDEQKGELTLFGLFGKNAGSINIDGMDCPVKENEWKPEQVICKIPKSATGDVQATVNGHKSNQRQISEWTFPISYQWVKAEPLEISGDFLLKFRADIGDYREKPGEAPLSWEGDTLIAMPDSLFTGKGSGTLINVKNGCSSSFTGSDTFKAEDQSLTARLKVDKSHAGFLGILFTKGMPNIIETSTCGAPPLPMMPPLNQLEMLYQFSNFATQLPSLRITYDDTFAVGPKFYMDSQSKAMLSWSAFKVSSSPDPSKEPDGGI